MKRYLSNIFAGILAIGFANSCNPVNQQESVEDNQPVSDVAYKSADSVIYKSADSVTYREVEGYEYDSSATLVENFLRAHEPDLKENERLVRLPIEGYENDTNKTILENYFDGTEEFIEVTLIDTNDLN